MNRSYLIIAAALLGFWWFTKKKPLAPATAGSLDSADKGGMWPTSWPTFNFGAPNVLGSSPTYAANPLAPAKVADPNNTPTPGFSGNYNEPDAIAKLPYSGTWVNAGVVTGYTENRRGNISAPKFQAP